MDDQVANLQEKVAFLENALQELSDEHYVQQRDLDRLKAQLENLINKVNNQSDRDDSSSEYSSIEDEKPPHY